MLGAKTMGYVQKSREILKTIRMCVTRIALSFSCSFTQSLPTHPSYTSYLHPRPEFRRNEVGREKGGVSGSRLVTLGLSRGERMLAHFSPSTLRTETGLGQRVAIWELLANVTRRVVSGKDRVTSVST